MIEPWREAIGQALAELRPGGTLHLVDFGAGEGLPPPLRRAIGAWLSPCGVHRRARCRDTSARRRRSGGASSAVGSSCAATPTC